VKDVIRAKKVAYNAWLQKKARSSLPLRYAETQNFAALTVKMFKTWEDFGHKLDSIIPLLASQPSILANHLAPPRQYC